MKNYGLAALFSLLIHGAMAFAVWTAVAHAPRFADSAFVALDLALLPTLAEVELGAAPVAVTPASPAPQPQVKAEPAAPLPPPRPEPAIVAVPPEPPPAVPALAPAPVVPVAVVAPPAVTPASSVPARAPVTLADAPSTRTGTGAAPVGAGRRPALRANAMSAQDFSALMNRLRQQVTYPHQARQMGWEGKVVVAFRLTREGQAEDVRVVTSSGHDLLDGSAVAAVQKASPFMPPARDTELILPVVYALE